MECVGPNIPRMEGLALFVSAIYLMVQVNMEE